MKRMHFVTTSCQFSFYTPEILFSKNKILEAIIKSYGSVFSGDTITVPLPPDAPKEIPRIIMHSSDGGLKLEIAESRVNLYVNQRASEAVDIVEFLKLSLKIAKSYKDSSSARIGRLAVVSVKYSTVENPAKELASHFCKAEWIKTPFDRPENFEIHGHKQYSREKFNLNSWVRCKTASLKEGDVPVVLVTQDINTLSEETEECDFAQEDLERFSKFVVSEQEQILKLYFPGD